jgi:hypothetical protein
MAPTQKKNVKPFSSVHCNSVEVNKMLTNAPFMDLFFTNEIADGMNKKNYGKILHYFTSFFWSSLLVYPLSVSCVLRTDDSMNKICTRLMCMNLE